MDNINYNNLNKMIKYIENNLVNEISMDELSKIVGISTNSLQRIFAFITGITITEYIKRRRLSKAFEEIKNTNIKIVDVAIKYQYNSTIAFDRAFKKAFGVTPIECRETNYIFKHFPIITFQNEIKCNLSKYEIKYLDKTEMYYYKTQTNNKVDLLYKIRELYKNLKESGIHEKLKEEEQYALSGHKNGEYYYIVGSKTKYSSNNKITIPEGKYAVFEVGSREQKEIVKCKKLICSDWIKSTNINIDNYFDVEYYKGNNCYIYLPIKSINKF